MEPEKVPELFEPFSQASTGIGRSYEGSGLGLALTRKVVRRMDGTVEVETAPGEGTCFTVWLPAAGRTPDQARMRLVDAANREQSKRKTAS
jgi:signal transduction histidine kinase